MTLCSSIAAITSSVDTLYARMRSGFSQTRIAYWRLPRMLATADAGDALQLRQDVHVREVVQELLVGLRVGAVQVDVHQHARLHARHDHALELHQLGERFITWSTRFFTLTTARSGSVPSSKTT
jgi:hypothetical protein